MYFPTIHTRVRISKHAAMRMRERAGLNTRPRREKFVRSASKSGLSLSMIPQRIFPEFFSYMKAIVDNSRKRTDDDCTIFLYKDYFLIISRYHGDIVTIINVDPKYKGEFDRIVQYRNTPRTDQEFSQIEKEAETILGASSNLNKTRNIVISIITSHGIRLEIAVDIVRKIVNEITKAKIAAAV